MIDWDFRLFHCRVATSVFIGRRYLYADAHSVLGHLLRYPKRMHRGQYSELRLGIASKNVLRHNAVRRRSTPPLPEGEREFAFFVLIIQLN